MKLRLSTWAVCGVAIISAAGPGFALAYFTDPELSSGNSFAAGSLDFRLSHDSFDTVIGPEASGEKTFSFAVLPESGSLSMQYAPSATTTEPLSALCSALTVDVKQNGVSRYSGSILGMSAATSTLGTGDAWEYRFDLPPLASVPHGDTCALDVVHKAHLASVPAEQSGFSDTETTHFTFTARMVVLNEVLPKPGTGASAPADKEFIELYNNGSTPVDVAGWRISEISGLSEEFYTIVGSGAGTGEIETYGGSTTIAPGGMIVLRWPGSASRLNDSGDTVRLYEGTTLLDTYTYGTSAAGKSHARIPDGIGVWIDPEPTPGAPNRVTESDLRAAGLDDEQIAEVLELMRLKGEAVPEGMPAPAPTSSTPEIEEQPEDAGAGGDQTPQTPSEALEAAGEEPADDGSGDEAPPPAPVAEPEPALPPEEQVMEPEGQQASEENAPPSEESEEPGEEATEEMPLPDDTAKEENTEVTPETEPADTPPPAGTEVVAPEPASTETE